MSSRAADLLGLALNPVLWAAGGWLLATHAFDLERRERLVVGLGLGLSIYLWAANLLGRWLESGWAFWLAALAVLACGLLAAIRSRRPLVDLGDWSAWRQLVALAVLAGFFTLLGRGLAILDDRKNLSLISLMAAGDIPPHFYMDPSTFFRYHYGFQLFGASLVRIGKLFPWSAFDLSKGLTGSLCLGLAWLVGRRLTGSRMGGLGLAFLAAFATGARWLLLFLPQSWLRLAGQGIDLWGSAATSAPGLLSALGAPWAVAGGPPAAIPFAFVNGALEPFVLWMQAGPVALSRAILFVALLGLGRARGLRGAAVLAALMASWALAWETDFVLFAIGLAGVSVLAAGWRRGPGWRGQLRYALGAALLGGLIGLLQGGTLTEVARSLLAHSAGASGGAAGFTWRWPPALVSAHLGELRLSDPLQVLVALLEYGPALLAAPLVTWAAFRWARTGRFGLASLAAGSILGLIIPCVLVYQADRDITRLTSFALFNWAVLAVPVLWRLGKLWRSEAFRLGVLAWGGALTFGGLVVFGSLLTALPHAVLSEAIAPVDAAMTRRFWDRLAPGALILDSHPYRAAIVTGRLTRSTGPDYQLLPEWQALMAAPDPKAIARQGYGYVYMDRVWWGRLDPVRRAAFAQPCVILMGTETDNALNGDRWLYDVRACAGG